SPLSFRRSPRQKRRVNIRTFGLSQSSRDRETQSEQHIEHAGKVYALFPLRVSVSPWPNLSTRALPEEVSLHLPFGRFPQSRRIVSDAAFKHELRFADILDA